MIDSHCHIQFPQYDEDREEVIKRTLVANCGLICVGTDLEMSKKALELAENHDMIWATVGAHPNEQDKEIEIESYEELAKNPKVVAIGEIGLDYYRTLEKEKQERQKKMLTQFIELGTRLKKPFIFHVRNPLRLPRSVSEAGRVEGEANAHEDMLEILKKSSSTGVIHSFAGDLELAQKYLDLGFYLGLNGIITFTNECDEMIAKIPLDKILIETDAPYLAPTPYRNKRNEPLWVDLVAKKIAEIKNVSEDDVIEKTEENAKRLFNLK